MSEPLLPDQTGDDTDVGWGDGHPEEGDAIAGDRWYLEERPPHHDR